MDWARRQAKKLLTEMTIEEKIGLLSTTQTPIERLKIGAYNIGGEIAHGVVDREKIQTTSFPTALGLSQTWNPILLKQVGAAMSDEARILYHQDPTGWLTPWAPTIDMERDPYWGRNEEGYGEDPHLTGELAVALIHGLQGDDEKYLKLAAAPKHFYANNNEAGRESTSNTVDLKNKYNYYLRPFEQAFKAGQAQSMMTAYNGINGVPMMQSPDLLEVVKGEWQMDGFIVTDGGALTLNIEDYQYYTDYSDAVADALQKGIDCFVDDQTLVETAAKKALDLGKVSEAVISRAVENTLTVRARLGHFAQTTPFDSIPKALLGGEQHDQLVKACLAEGSVLLKNEAVLPLKRTEQVLLTGPSANRYPRDWYAGIPMNEITAAEALNTVDFAPNMNYQASGEKVKIQTANGFIEIAENGDAVEGKHGAIFELEDWGFGKGFLRETSSQRYLVLAEDGHYQLNKTEVYDWFAKETFHLEPVLRSYFERNLAIIDGRLCESNRDTTSVTLTVVEQMTLEMLEKAAQFDKVVYIGGNHPMLNGREHRIGRD